MGYFVENSINFNRSDEGGLLESFGVGATYRIIKIFPKLREIKLKSLGDDLIIKLSYDEVEKMLGLNHKDFYEPKNT